MNWIESIKEVKKAQDNDRLVIFVGAGVSANSKLPNWSQLIADIANRIGYKGICDKCGGELYQREDQKPEVVENRLQVYSKTAEELINHYKKANILYDAKAGDKVGKTSYDVAKEVEEYIKNN